MLDPREPAKGPRKDFRDMKDGFLPGRTAEMAVRLLAVLTLTGFAIKNFYVGYLTLSAALLVCCVMTGLNLWADVKRRRLFVQTDLIIAAYVLVLLLSTARLGVSGALWAFPVLVASRSLGTRGSIVPLTLVLAATIPLIVAYQGDPANAARLFGALMFTSFYVAYDHMQSTNPLSGSSLHQRDDNLQPGIDLSRLESRLKDMDDTEAGEVLVLRIANYEDIRRDMGPSAAQVLLSRSFEITQSVLGEHVPVYAAKEAEFLTYLEGWTDFEARALADRLQSRLRASSALHKAAAVVEIGVGSVIDKDNLDLAIAQARRDATTSCGFFTKGARAASLFKA